MGSIVLPAGSLFTSQSAWSLDHQHLQELILSVHGLHWISQAQCRITSNNCWQALQAHTVHTCSFLLLTLMDKDIFALCRCYCHSLSYTHIDGMKYWHFWLYAVRIEDSFENFEHKLGQNVEIYHNHQKCPPQSCGSAARRRRRRGRVRGRRRRRRSRLRDTTRTKRATIVKTTPCGPSLKRSFSSARRLHLFLSVCPILHFEILNRQKVKELFGL